LRRENNGHAPSFCAAKKPSDDPNCRNRLSSHLRLEYAVTPQCGSAACDFSNRRATDGGTVIKQQAKHIARKLSPGWEEAIVSNDHRGLGEASAAIFQLVFSLTFPLLLITLCGVSFMLTAFGAPEFSLWARLAGGALGYAGSSIWAALGLIVFCLAALPLAWVAYREQQISVSTIIKAWVIAAMLLVGMFWLRTAWRYDDTGSQRLVYGLILLGGWGAVIEATLGTLRLMEHVRANRPQPAQPPAQEPHGSRDRRKSGSDPETI
jgi:hypothetical protein